MLLFSAAIKAADDENIQLALEVAGDGLVGCLDDRFATVKACVEKDRNTSKICEPFNYRMERRVRPWADRLDTCCSVENALPQVLG